ncbi:MAG: MarR family winged helix-turn-helix transcriptional regulator [Candidatus Dormibacteraceae bacterium]
MANQLAPVTAPPATRLSGAEVAARLRIAMARMTRRLRRQTDAEHSASALSALATVSRDGPITLGEMAKAEGVSRPSMTVIAAGLAAQGLVTRAADTGDRRVVRIAITPAGQQALQRSRTRRDAYLATRLRTLDDDELGVLDSAAAILERLLEKGS